MKSLLPTLLSVILLAVPAGISKSRSDKQQAAPVTGTAATGAAASDNGGAPSNSGAGGTAATADSAAGDVNKTLDRLLSQPADATPESEPAPLSPSLPVPPAAAIAPALPAPSGTLQGEAQLNESAAAAGTSSQPPLQQGNSAPKLLQGEAAISGLKLDARVQDPDAADEQLMIQWDRWRNRFLRAVQMQVQATVNSPDPDMRVRRHFDPLTGMVLPRFPLGTEAWFDCEISADRRVLRVAITQPSGSPDYDRAILDSIRALEGTSLLEFPRGSHRQSVRQEAGIRTAATSDFQFYNFGDVERYNTQGQGGGN